ncbi:MAG: prephenate dehydrogenase/arogenate dehydrogenase family protein [Desulforegulaceae bacterium]|nr:prephenate dehydrogenase/arogenate dehydrogenase family protein [Desulforegulaceae bacterium]
MKDESFFKNKTIGIIGGLGVMGVWLRRYFEKKGFKVIVSDINTELTNEMLAEESDIVILSTPMEAALEVVESIGCLLADDKLLMDICSLKTDIVKKMLESTNCEVLGCHPMFGQYTEDLNGQNIIICKGRGNSYTDVFKNIFEKDGAVVTISTPEIHDRYMSIVQGLTHLLTIATGEFLKAQNIAPEAILKFSTPVFRVNLALVGRLFGLDLSLYKDLVSRNKETKEMTNTFNSCVEKSLKVFTDKTEEEKMEFLNSIKDFMGDSSRSALKETNALFNFLYKC